MGAFFAHLLSTVQAFSLFVLYLMMLLADNCKDIDMILPISSHHRRSALQIATVDPHGPAPD